MGTPPSANGDARPKTRGCPTVPLWDKVRADPADFNCWTALIGAAERTEDVHKIRAVYDAFLAEFPLCYGYWKKYADAESRLAGIDGVEHVYERATHAFPYSIDLWTQRASHAIAMRRDAEKVRELFESGLAYAGTDWLAHPLWDAYIQFEQHSGCGSPVHVTRLYGRVLRVPLKELDKYWAGFETFVTNRSPSAVIPPEELRAIDAAVGGIPPKGATAPGATAASRLATDAAASNGVDGGDGAEEAAEAAARAAATEAAGGSDPRLLRFRDVRFETYRATLAVRATREPFEQRVKRPYFHVKPLDDAQLANWDTYLDNEERAGDVSSVTRLYERCLVPCASYSRFWLRYARWQASDAGQGVAAARAALQRAANVFCKRDVEVHFALARFEEAVGDVDAARAAYAHVADDVAPGLLRCVVERANLERRAGALDVAKETYERAMQVEKSREGAGSKAYGVLACKYAAMLHEACGDVEGARKVYERAAEVGDGANALVWDGWLNFERSVGASFANVRAVVERCCDGVFDEPRTSGSHPSGLQPRLPERDRARISRALVEYADLVGTTEQLADAERAHERRFPARAAPPGGGEDGGAGRKRSAAAAGVEDVAAHHAAYYAQRGYQLPAQYYHQ